MGEYGEGCFLGCPPHVTGGKVDLGPSGLEMWRLVLAVG